VHSSASGLQYEILEEGNGAKPGPTSQVTVHYHGTLIDGTVFDSSVQRGAPATFGVNQVIRGWTEALQLMSEGAKYRLSIPQELAYGANPHPGGAIQPYAALIFDVELISIA
jgi:FKBP-type peptidyl-prolyl cis-trans isomerase FklB